MPSLFRRQPADRNADAPPEPLAAAAHQIGALLGQLQAVDHLTMAALVNGRDTELALDIRRQLGMAMVAAAPYPGGDAR